MADLDLDVLNEDARLGFITKEQAVALIAEVELRRAEAERLRKEVAVARMPPEPQQCDCGLWSRGLVDGVCADCRALAKTPERP